MKLILYFLLLCVVSQSCMVPVNLNYENASTLEKGNIEVKAAYSQNLSNEEYTWVTGEINSHIYSASFGYGKTDDFDFKIRYSYIDPDDIKFSNRHFLELDLKHSLIKDKVAFSFPFQIYSDLPGDLFDVETLFIATTPKLIFTPLKSKFIDWSIIPKVHVMLGLTGIGIYPGVSTNIGFRLMEEQIIIRPEVGIARRPQWDNGLEDISDFDSVLSFGVGVSYVITK